MAAAACVTDEPGTSVQREMSGPGKNSQIGIANAGQSIQELRGFI
jgi:hypothetical protein